MSTRERQDFSEEQLLAAAQTIGATDIKLQGNGLLLKETAAKMISSTVTDSQLNSLREEGFLTADQLAYFIKQNEDADVYILDVVEILQRNKKEAAESYVVLDTSVYLASVMIVIGILYSAAGYALAQEVQSAELGIEIYAIQTVNITAILVFLFGFALLAEQALSRRQLQNQDDYLSQQEDLLSDQKSSSSDQG